jgi:hypothetical protein
MEAKAINEIPTAIAHTVDLIKGCDEMILSFKKMGEKDTSLMIRQELHLRKQYVSDLNEMLKEIHLKVYDTLLMAA